MQARPLEGIRVVDYSHFLAGPYVGRCLAAPGAEAIKVERPGSKEPGTYTGAVIARAARIAPCWNCRFCSARKRRARRRAER